MTNEQKALVERLYGDLPDTMIEGHNVTDYDAVIRQNHQAADTIEAQAREIARLRDMLKPQWFYLGDDQSSDRCRFSVDEVLEYELCGWGPPKTGKHVVHVSTALPGPDIWVALHVFTDEEKDARGDDETWTFEEFSTEDEARAALEGTSHD